MIRIAFFDVDHTLLSHTTYTVSERDRKSLSLLQKKGIRVCLCTGRNRTELEKLGILQLLSTDALVLLAGQFAECDGRRIYSNPFPAVFVEQIIEKLRHKEMRGFLMYEDSIIADSEDPGIDDLYYFYNGNEGVMQLEKGLEKAKQEDCYEISLVLKEDDIASLQIPTDRYRYARFGENGFDLFPADGGKSAGMEAVLHYYGISSEETIAFGDSPNDTDMLQMAGIAVAMGNADEKTKQTADYITEDVEHDGVTKALVYFGLLNQEEII